SDDKDDSGDAYKLAELVYLKPRLLHPIQHRSPQAQADLSWIRAREVLVESRTQMLNAIRGMSKAFGERLQKCSVESFTTQRAEQIPAAIRAAVVPLLERQRDFNPPEQRAAQRTVWVSTTAPDPSATPPVDPWSHVPPLPRRKSGALFGSWA